MESTADIFSLYRTPSEPCEFYQQILYSVEGKQVLDYLLEVRKLKHSTIKHFKLGATEAGEVVIPVFKDSKLIDYKFRSIKEKSFRRFPDSQTWVVNEEAFYQAAEKGYLIITEGEFDTMAVYQMGFHAVISGTGGANDRAEWLSRIPDVIKKVYLNYDNDEPGQDAARKIAERIGLEKCYNVILPTKDANDFIRGEFTADDYSKILRNSPRFTIKDVYKVGDVIEQLKNNKILRMPTFLNRINIHTEGGIPVESLVVMSGRTGVGKSTTLMNFLVHHANEGKAVMLISLENNIHFVVQRLLEVKYQKRLKDFTKRDWAKANKDLVDYPFYIDMSMNRYDMKEIGKIVKQAKKLYNIEILGFDHIGFLPNRKYNVSSEVAQMSRDFKVLARDTRIIIYLISHIRKIDKDSTMITGEDLKDSSALQQDADMVFLLFNTREGMELLIDKARMSKSHLRIPILFNGDTGIIQDDMSRQVKMFDEVIDDVYPESVKMEIVSDDPSEIMDSIT